MTLFTANKTAIQEISWLATINLISFRKKNMISATNSRYMENQFLTSMLTEYIYVIDNYKDQISKDYVKVNVPLVKDDYVDFRFTPRDHLQVTDKINPEEYLFVDFPDQILKRDSVERASLFFSPHGRAQEKCEEPLNLDQRDNSFHLRASNPYKDLVFDSNDENNDLLKEMDGAPIFDVYDDADPTLNVFHKENNIGGIQNVKELTLGPSERVMIDGVCPDRGCSTNFFYHGDNWFWGSDKYFMFGESFCCANDNVSYKMCDAIMLDIYIDSQRGEHIASDGEIFIEIYGYSTIVIHQADAEPPDRDQLNDHFLHVLQEDALPNEDVHMSFLKIQQVADSHMNSSKTESMTWAYRKGEQRGSLSYHHRLGFQF